MVQKTHTGRDCKYNEYDLLNISMGDKQNGVVIINTKITKKKRKYMFANTCVQLHGTHMYTIMLTKYRVLKSFMKS